MTTDRTAYALLTVMAVSFAGTWVAAPWATDDVSPLTVAFVRFLLASVCLLAFTRAIHLPTPIKRADLPIAFAMGSTAVVGYNILFLYGVTLAPSTDGAIITPGLVPIFTAVLVRIVYGERLARRGVVGLGLGIVGLVLVVGPAVGGSSERFLGDLMFISGALMWSIYTLISRRATLRLHPAHATLLATLTGTLMLLPLSILERGWEPLMHASARSLLSIAYLGVIGTAVAFATFSEGIRRIGSARAAAFIVLVPVLGVVLSAWLLDDPITQLGMAGAVLVLGGLWLIQTAARHVPTSPAVTGGLGATPS
jgi:drug/metabolite transporter (DMT)-like permease